MIILVYYRVLGLDVTLKFQNLYTLMNNVMTYVFKKKPLNICCYLFTWLSLVSMYSSVGLFVSMYSSVSLLVSMYSSVSLLVSMYSSVG